MIGSGLKAANQNLSNLIDVAIDAPLIPDITNLYDFGTDSLRWKDGYFSGMLTVYDLTVESGSSIHLAGATFENKGHYTSIDTNWMVEHDDQPTAFIGVYAKDTDIMTHANLILDAQGSPLDIIKNSPLHPWAPYESWFINDGGNHSIFVDHSSEISWQHFTELTKDEYGNITDLTDIQSLMRLTDDYLKLEDVGLLVNDIEIVSDSGVLQESDPVYSAWDKSTGISITESQISDLNHFSGAIADLTGDGPLQFLSATGQKINLYSTTYALGVESGELRIASNQAISFRTGGYSGAERALLSEPGTFKVPYRIQTPILYHPDGILKIQPYAQYDVELFGDTNVANNENSKIFKVWRRAAEGNDYIRFYISSSRKAFIHASNELTLQAQQPFTINSVTDDIFFKVGDNAGVKKFYFQDSDNNDIATIDSDGNAYFEGDLEVDGAGTILGDMGIGIATPDEKLHIYDGKIRIEGVSIDPSLFFTDNSDDDTWGFLLDRSEHDFHIVMRSAGRTPSHLDDMMTFTPTFYVGIKQSNPTCELDINGDLNVDGDITLIGTVDGINIAALSAAVDLKAPKDSPIFTGDAIFDTDTLFIDSTNKRIGIGTLDPREEVHIKSEHPTITFEESDAASNEGVWEFGATIEEFLFRTANDLHTGNQTIWKATGRSGTSITEFLIPNAKVGIGTETLSGKLTIDQSNASGAIPVLTLDQGDVSEPWIEFLGGTITTGKTGQNEYLEVKVGGNTRYLRLFN